MIKIVVDLFYRFIDLFWCFNVFMNKIEEILVRLKYIQLCEVMIWVRYGQIFCIFLIKINIYFIYFYIFRKYMYRFIIIEYFVDKYVVINYYQVFI